jgi:MraZ protein
MFFGEHPHSIDSKGRLTIPSRLRAPLKDYSIDQFVVTRGFDPCLYMFAPGEWHQIDKRFRALKLLTKAKSRALQRLFFSGAAIVDCDRQGRILIPRHLLDYAGVNKDVMVVGLSSRIEIWPLEGWKTEYDRLKDSYADLAEELMDLENPE